MPIYEYECNICGVRAEKLVLGDEGYDGVACPYCAGGLLFKVPSATNFRIKGYSEANGYNLPSESDVLNPDGTGKPISKWGR